MPTHGFLLLAPSSVPGYWGVDRKGGFGARAERPPTAPRDYQDSPFVPMLIDGLMDPSYCPKKGDDALWAFYPAGWRRDAYRLYDENSVAHGKWDLDRPDLLTSREAAQKIREIIEPHLGPYEIVACDIWELNSVPADEAGDTATFLGYDVAYPPGGDYFSAIKNGLFTIPFSYSEGPASPELVEEFRSMLNQFGLFPNTKPISSYLRRFKELVPSEADSGFCVYRLVTA
jgi:hypothetical protein